MQAWHAISQRAKQKMVLCVSNGEEGHQGWHAKVFSLSTGFGAVTLKPVEAPIKDGTPDFCGACAGAAQNGE